MSHFFAIHVDHRLIHGWEGFEQPPTPIIYMLECQNYFQWLNFCLFKIITLFNTDILLFFEKFIFPNHLILLLFFCINFDRRNFLNVFLKSLQLLRSDRDYCSINCQTDASNELWVLAVSIENKLQEEICLIGFVWLDYCWKGYILF